MAGKLILVTGVTGFVAAHVAEQALEKGYRVRGTARGAKLARLQSLKIPNLEFVEVNDLASGDLSEALKGVDIVMHVAAPLPGAASIESTVSTAVDGPLHLVKQAEKAGIEQIIITSTFGNTMDPSLVPGFSGKSINDSEWGTTSKELIFEKAEDIYYTYFAAKNLGERAIWDYAREHPKVDITTILPGFIFGPWSKILPPPASAKELGTNTFPYLIVTGNYPPQGPPFIVDVRDVAKAHILAIDLPRSKNIGSKRYLINSGNLTWKEAAEHLQKVRPQGKYASLDGYKDLPGPAATLDTTRAQKELGFKSFIDPKKTMEDAADHIFELSKKWEA